MNKIYTSLLGGIFLINAFSCNSDHKTANQETQGTTKKACLVPSDRNPNGASELAQLMRRMESQTELWKSEIQEAKDSLSPMPGIYETLKTASVTEPEMKNEHFDAFADDFIRYASDLVKAPKKERKTAFNTMVGGCMACHGQMCPGPMKRIGKFYFE